MRVWAITGGRRGNDVLVLGIARALGFEPQLIHTHLKPPWRWLSPYRAAFAGVRGDSAIAPPYPDLVLASGRQAAAHARYIGYRSGGHSFTAFFQKPTINPRYFDFVWAPQHDRLHGPNVTTTLLSPHLLTQETLKAEADKWRVRLLGECGGRRPVAALIGGPNEAYAFTMAEFERLTAHIVTLTAQNMFPMITVSRRSPPAFAAHLRARLAQTPHFIWDNAGDNPYAALLGLAEHIIVTADSVNMVGEACTSSAPVQVFELAGGNRKFRTFHGDMQGAGLTRPFVGVLNARVSAPANATPEIAAALQNAWDAKRARFVRKKSKTSE